MAIVDVHGKRCVVHKSVGCWLEEADFTFSGEDDNVTGLQLGPHGFPRDWPEVYQDSDVLRNLLNKKGPCPAKRVSAAAAPTPGQRHLADGVRVQWLQSFQNAQAIKEKAGLDVVQGWDIEYKDSCRGTSSRLIKWKTRRPAYVLVEQWKTTESHQHS